MCIRDSCDFLSFPSSAEDREEYVRCLVKEIEQTGIVLNNKDTYQVRSVFIGGGTPSLLSGDQIKNIMQVVQKYFLIKEEAEITMEANPGTLTKKNLSAYKEDVYKRQVYSRENLLNIVWGYDYPGDVRTRCV